MPKVQPAATGGTRLGRGRRVTSSLSEINVVPLVDVMLVLLIIFMVTAPMLQQGIDVKLPRSRSAAAVEGERITVTVPLNFQRDRKVYLGDELLPIDVMQERIRQKMEGRSEKQVSLRGDGGVLYQDLMQVFDRLRTAGVTTIGLVTQPEP